MTTHTLIAEIDEVLAEWQRSPFRLRALLSWQSHSSTADTVDEMVRLLAQCRAALIARDGIWASYPAPYRDEEADAMNDDELAERVARGEWWAH